MPSVKITAVCSFCNNEFTRGKYDIEKTIKNKGVVFCSITCSKQHYRKEILNKGFSETKACSKCKIEKPRNSEHFPLHNLKLDGLDSWCRKCRATYRSEFRRGMYRSMISDEDLLEMLKTEECTICGSKEKLVVDHDHNRNFVRGMLCNHCNRGLGHFRDDPMLLEFAKMYIQCFSDDEEEVKEFDEYMDENS
jgi:hypothetical protein